jgi:eukaryotic-like serine/threonine-protein kinase
VSAGGESGARGALPEPDLSLHGLTISPEKPAKPVEPLPAPAGGFTFVRELGRGGMGVVYEALEDATGRRVAIKIIAQRLGGSTRAVERFEREARLAASIAHPNCVFVYGAHEVHGAAAISMELMTGQTLDDRIKSGEPVPVEKAVQWGIEILEGLAAAHAVGIVHRDVKPSNCFLTADGHVKVGDFGLSRSIDSDLGLTQSGSFVGSPLYASPEQVRGRAVDHRADVYSAGATLYAVLAGRPPHGGLSIGDVLAQIVSEAPPPLNSVRQGLPHGLDGVVQRALAKDPAKRFADCAAFQRALLPFAPGSLSPATLGLRIVAYVVDMMVVSVAYQAVCAALYFARVRFEGADPNASWLPTRGVGAWLFPTLGNVVYFTMLESLVGTTPGKSLFGLRVVTIDGGRVPLWRAAIRSFVFFAPSTVPSFFWGIETRPLQMLARLPTYLFPMITMRPSNAWRGFHEFASGTRVLRALPRALAPGSVAAALDPARPPASGVGAAIGPYAVEGLIGSTASGPVVVGHDPSLDRSVWIHLGGHARAPSGSPRPTGLRWLHHAEQPQPHDVYESPGGASLGEYSAAGVTFPWPAAAPQLAALADDLAERSAPVASSQIWVDRSGRLRVLDFAISDSAVPASPASEILAAAARVLLVGRSGGQARLPQDLPVHAEPAVRRLLGLAPPFSTIAEARDSLGAVASRPAVVTRLRRLAQMALTAFMLGWVALILIISSRTVLNPAQAQKMGPLGVDRAQGGIAVFLVLVMVVAPSLILGFALRGGLTFTVLGIRIRNRRGELASRLRCLLRSFAACLPVIPIVAAGVIVARGEAPPSPWILIGGLASTAAYITGAWLSLLRPTEGLADRIARTRLVVK